MRRNIFIFIAIILVLAIGIVVGRLSYTHDVGGKDQTVPVTQKDIGRLGKHQPLPTAPPVPNTAPNTNNNAKQQGIMYTNSRYGFDLTFPKEWEGYTTNVQTVEANEFCMDCANIDFLLPDRNRKSFPVLTVFAIDHVSLKKNLAANTFSCNEEPNGKNCPKSQWHLGDNDRYVFFYSDRRLDAPNDPKTIAPDELKSYSIKFVKANFKAK